MPVNKFISRIKQKSNLIKFRLFNNFVFIHINKTGGSSVEKALNLPYEHKTALEKIEELGRNNWDRCLTFTVIRNPWDKVVSHYHYRVQTNQTNLRDNPIPFKEWVERAYGNHDPLYYDKPKMFLPQIDWIADKDGRILVNEIIHFENLNDEFSNIMKKLGKTVILPHEKSSKRGHYRDYYDAETAQIIEDYFKRDLDNFGYTF